MRSFWIRPDGSYYEGNREHPLDIEVPQRPSLLHEWNGEAWVQNAAGARAEAWEKIKAERERRTLQGGYQAAGKWFHSDAISRVQQIGLVLLGNNIPANTHWKTMDGTFILMTPQLAQQIFGAAAASDIAIFAAAEAHKAAMEEAEDPASYDFSGGWPAVFGE